MTARLAALLDDVEVAEVIGGDAWDVEVTGVTQDSSAVVAGTLYCCIVGRTVDGHDLAPDVVRAGARSLLVERVVDVAVPQVRVPSTRSAVAPVAAAYFGKPSSRMDVIGVTGTNGKTTTTHLIGAILRTAGWRTGLLGTLSGARTTPEAPILQLRLAEFLDDGCRAVAVEVSSMALDQHRADAIDFAVAVWTNLTQDHLDYHGDMESYFAAKARLFEPERCRAAVINGDDPWAARLDLAVPVATYRLSDASDLTTSPAGSAFRWRGQQVMLPLGGIHNVANALAAATACAVLGIEPAIIAAGLTNAPPIPGRWELIDGGQDFTVVVDYAHTPDGLEQVLGAARSAVGPDGRVLVVFGCGGDRDRAKRPLMTAAATRLADVSVLTTDNPRSEDPLAILAEAAAGAAEGAVMVIEADREAAIGVAIDEARAGDLVLIAGKGHETGQVIGDRVLPFDDREVARAHLAREGPIVVSLLISGSVALIVSLVGTPLLIRSLRARGIGQQIREDGPQGHVTKAGTPTMGGIVIVAAAVLGYAAGHLRTASRGHLKINAVFTTPGLTVIIAILGAGIVGLVDDWTGIRRQRNLGLNKRAKILGQLLVGTLFAVLAVKWAKVSTDVSFTRLSGSSVHLGAIPYGIFAVFVIIGSSNAVNLTDGLDGLAAGSSAFAFSALVVISFWEFRHGAFYRVPHSANALDMALIAAGMVGGCAGFLWWNAAPAQIFMGDVGSLAIGAALAAICLVDHVDLLLPVIGGLFVLETLSVVVQVASFRIYHRRVFRMAPIHHHFELGGWPETTVIVRFWILAGLFTAMALGIFYYNFISLGGLD